MPNGTGNYPSFSLHSNLNTDLDALGCNPWTYYAATALQFLGDENPPSLSMRMPFRLDTGAWISA